ncbi:MAG: hypothetical protein CFE28_14065 [Alphaproteobacteria bacterium PA2]|nr:MAG: hypothetical protein CFE28_14065 [Alphaproteobacteria bacterium PA2]
MGAPMPSMTKLSRSALAAMASVSAFALAPSAQAGPVKPMYGNVSPLWGSVAPVYGNVSPLYGNVSPLYGNVSPLYGNVSPLYGNVSPLYGNVSPLWGTVHPYYGNVSPLWGSIKALDGSATELNPYTASSSTLNGVSAFWGTTSPYTNNMTGAGLNTYWKNAGLTWNDINTSWAAIPAGSPASAYQTIVTKLNALGQTNATFWNPAIKAKTGGVGYVQTVSNPLLAKYGLDLSNPATLAQMDQTKRGMFFLDLYDSLMKYTGTDHVDYWMNLVQWSPSLTQTQGSGADTTIGLLDFTVSGNTTVTKNVIAYSGVSQFTNGHGVAVGSLMVGAHDGKGVMGIAPKSKVIAYNPFDATGTTNWTDITTGVIAMTTDTANYKGASIVNASLGEPGLALAQGWNTVFTSPGVSAVANKTVFVIAAGNEGVAQTTNITWNFNTNPDVLIVGSVNSVGYISNFSNTPGNACMLASGTSTCVAGNYLKDHFLVAPGELILIDDGAGGVVRQSGTSLAAPLVSGAVALVHDRWKWLANYPKVTNYIILNSARDIGDPGVDPIYGHGLLDITAAQSPLNWDNLTYYTGTATANNTGVISTNTLTQRSVSTIITQSKLEKQKTWDAQGLFIYAIEELGPTRRDFAIPVARKLIGQNVVRLNGSTEKFQAYLVDRMGTWVDSKPGFAEDSSKANFAGFAKGVAMRNPWGADMSLTLAPQSRRDGFVQTGVAYQSRLHIAGDGSEAEFGFGDGAVTLGAMPGFGQAADYDATRGGANPLLGLASGGAFGKIAFNLTDNVQVSAGSTQRNDLRDTGSSPGLRVLGNGAERYEAAATNLGVNVKVAEGVHILGGLTHLTEASGLLGIQSLEASDLGAGSTTDGYNVGVDAALGPNTRLAVSGTVGKTRTNGGQAFSAKDMTSTAYQVSLTQGDLFAKGDVVRISVSQPLHVEKGDLAFTSYGIADRETGELGFITQHIGTAPPRPLATEMLYGRPVLKGLGEVSFYGRVDTDTSNTETTYMSGARFKFRF